MAFMRDFDGWYVVDIPNEFNNMLFEIVGSREFGIIVINEVPAEREVVVSVDGWIVPVTRHSEGVQH